MIKFALMGVGRIGKMHANNIFLNSRSKLEIVYDPNLESANEVAKLYRCDVANSPIEAISNKNVDAVFIASATPTHIEYILSSAKAAKPIFCDEIAPYYLDLCFNLIAILNYKYIYIKND